MKDTLEVAKFRFNKTFHLVGADEFLKDLFNSKTVVQNFGPLYGMESGKVTDVKHPQLNCNVLNMSFFDVFHETGVCTDDGTIRMDMEE